MNFCNVGPQKSRILKASWLLLAASALPVHAAEPEEVGLQPMAVAAGPYHFNTAEQQGIQVDIVARGLSHGYSLAFLPGQDALIVERGVRLRLLRNATGAAPELVDTPIAGVPDFSGHDHMLPDDVLGIQDVAPHPNFADNHLLYYTYNRPVAYDAAARRLTMATVVARARLENGRLSQSQDLVVGETVIGAGGSRILFGKNDDLYVSVGGLSTGDIDSAQRTDNIYGKILRIRMDGTVPANNPFVKTKGARPEIYSFGHRDPLGLILDGRSGAILASEHGPQGGDEVNRILPGRNYGWPTYSYGTQYGGSPLPAVPVGPGTEPPLMIWMPAIAPAGIALYNGDKFPGWKNNLFIASARRGEINGTGSVVRVVLNDQMQELRQEHLLGDLHQRFKDVRQGPDGLLYALTDEDASVLIRISPAVQK